MLGNFACGRYRFVLEATTPLWLRAFAGATLRGGFGHVFKRTVCLWPRSERMLDSHKEWDALRPMNHT